ncbi:MAG: pullulanase-associated domain-containing protein [Alkalibacterium sp.]|nr:pullulanase-associated domain-containing protein [Alkalibacterium sp.]
MIRINYSRNNEDYENWGLWTWEDVLKATDELGMTGAQDSDGIGEYGTFF